MIDESVLKNFNETAWTNKISEPYGEIEKQDACFFFSLIAADFILFGLWTNYQAWRELEDVFNKCNYPSPALLLLSFGLTLVNEAVQQINSRL